MRKARLAMREERTLKERPSQWSRAGMHAAASEGSCTVHHALVGERIGQEKLLH